MPRTYADRIDDAERRHESAQRRKAAAGVAMREILDRAKAQQRTHLTAAEDRRFGELATERDRMQAEETAAAAERDTLIQARDEDAQIDRLAAQTRPDEGVVGTMRGGGVADVAAGGGRTAGEVRLAAAQARQGGGTGTGWRVGGEPRTYHPDRGAGHAAGEAFLRDVVNASLGRDPGASQRLARHMQEEEVERGEYLRQSRAAGTGNFAGLVVPQYLTDMYARKVRTRRPFADACVPHPLPAQGMTVNISKITTGSTVGVQANEGDTVSNQDLDDTLLTEDVLTASGYVDLSRQAIDRGTGIENVTMGDLQAAYASALDSELLNRATVGALALATVETFDNTVPTAAMVWQHIAAAASAIETASEGELIADLVVMHSRRWRWLTSRVTTQWPFFSIPNVPTQQVGTIDATGPGGGVRGRLSSGELVIADNNLPTDGGAGSNEDVIIVASSDECHLWEDPNAPQFIRAEQVQAEKLLVRLVIYGYFAFSFRRYPTVLEKIAGTGLVTPSFVD